MHSACGVPATGSTSPTTYCQIARSVRRVAPMSSTAAGKGLPMSLEKSVFTLAIALCLVAPAGAMSNGHGNGPAGCSSADLAAARATVATSCDCASATRHGKYVSCGRHALKAAVVAGTVSRACRRATQQAVVHSICGKPGFVTCCRTRGSGATSCSIKSDPSACQAPHGGSACVASATSCADACSDTGCASPSGAFLE